jgi:hypothetical protein
MAERASFKSDTKGSFGFSKALILQIVAALLLKGETLLDVRKGFLQEHLLFLGYCWWFQSLIQVPLRLNQLSQLNCCPTDVNVHLGIVGALQLSQNGTAVLDASRVVADVKECGRTIGIQGRQ